MKKSTRRGLNEQNQRWFSYSELIRLQKASEQIERLINGDYQLDQVITFVRDQYQFSTRQRESSMRALVVLIRGIVGE